MIICSIMEEEGSWKFSCLFSDKSLRCSVKSCFRVINFFIFSKSRRIALIVNDLEYHLLTMLANFSYVFKFEKKEFFFL